jgi:hypothetical protein
VIEVKVTGLAELRAALDGFSDRRFGAAIATALTRTGQKMRDDLKTEMMRKLDRPTPYTLNALYLEGAKADWLQARVWFKEETTKAGTPAGKYLLTQIEGGTRRMKRLEVALNAAGALPSGYLIAPGPGATIDAYGNVSRGQIVQVLSQLRIQLVAGSTRNMSFDARKQITAQRKAGGRFFVVPVGGRTAPGVYQREMFGKSVTPVFFFIKQARYSKRFDFFGAAQQSADRNLNVEITRSVQEHIAKLGAKN